MSCELKRCPFCGSTPRLAKDMDEDLWSHNIVEWQQVKCTECECEGIRSCEGFEVDAVTMWNTRVPQWVLIEFNEDGDPTNVPEETPILVPPTKRLGMTVAKWSKRDGWETETTSEWVGIYRPTHFQPLPAEPELPA